jgi:hypothetical protein
MPGNRFCQEVLSSRWLLLTILVMVVFLGVIDYLTGDYGILVFYTIPVVLGAWFRGLYWGLIVAFLSGFVRLYADYNTYTDFSIRRSVCVLEDELFLLMIVIMTLMVRKMLGKSRTFLR